jgi:hypothetical protein
MEHQRSRLGDGSRLRVHNSGWFNNHDHNHNIDKHHQHDTSRVHNNFFHDNFHDFIYNNPSTRNDHNDFDNSCTNNHANDNNNVNDDHPSSNNDHNFCTIYTSSDHDD